MRMPGVGGGENVCANRISQLITDMEIIDIDIASLTAELGSAPGHEKSENGRVCHAVRLDIRWGGVTAAVLSKSFGDDERLI
jgi:hypothetical protein